MLKLLFLQSKSVSNEVSGRGWREFDWANLHPNTTQNLTIGHGEGALLFVGGRTFRSWPSRRNKATAPVSIYCEHTVQKT